jgi:hypothetical protein
MCFDFVYKFCLRHLSLLEEFIETMSQTYTSLHFKYPLFFLMVEVVPFAKRPTNTQGSSGFFINTFQIFYPDMFRHMVAILRGAVSA